MPQLPSGLHIALDHSPLQRVFEQAYEGKFVHVLMAIKQPSDMFEHMDILYLRPRSPETAPWRSDPNSAPLPQNMEPYPSGYNLLTIRQEHAKWSKDDQEAFIEFLDSPRTEAYFQDALDAVRANQQDLLDHPSTLPGLIATWWKFGCHPLQEPLDD